MLDKQEMVERNKLHRVRAEDTILSTVDHPFVATLYTSFQTDSALYFVMEYCEGGELYDLRMKQPNKRFAEGHARFYVAEVLLALQYLHLLGFIYRDLKPENVLLQASGHVMLTDFDLSYCASSRPHVLNPPKRGDPPVLVAEPFALTNSFIGTEEYLAPEVINASGHNSSIDWWELGIFLYELTFGFTPFCGAHREQTFENVLSKPLHIPTEPVTSPQAKDLITELLQRNPMHRLGSQSGAEEIKAHAFFRGINWALLRNETPPFIPASGQKKGAASEDEELFRMDAE